MFFHKHILSQGQAGEFEFTFYINIQFEVLIFLKVMGAAEQLTEQKK